MQIPDNVTPLDQSRLDADRAWNEKKKERTKAALVEAAVRLMAQRGVAAVTVNDIVSEASVAPGTFYNYFSSFEVLLEELTQTLVESVQSCNARRASARDPGSRLARVIRAHLQRAREDAPWARLLVQLAGVDGGPVRTALLRGLEDDIIDGIGKGQFSAEPDESAPDLVVGALLTGILRVADRHVGVDYSHNLTANILRGLGMVSAAALERAQRGV